MQPSSRRTFLETSAAAAAGVAVPSSFAPGRSSAGPGAPPLVNFWADGPMPGPAEHAALLQEIAATEPDLKDRYGKGGAVERLEARFAELTGKEGALYLPSGTMANQLAIRALSGDASKVIVQEASHVFRDEADAAQVVHGKRLVPLAPGRAAFTAGELGEAMDALRDGEAFPTPAGALSIESPVRRAEGQAFPFEELGRVCALARERGLGLHLDGARLLVACGYTGIPASSYAALFDTVYVSLYKYLGAPAGAVLCGTGAVLDRVARLRKVHGGDLYQSWPNAAAALRGVERFPARLAEARGKADALFAALGATGRYTVEPVPHGSNVFRLGIGAADAGRLVETMKSRWGVILPGAGADGRIRVHVNESQLGRSNDELLEAFEDAHDHAS